MRFGIRQRERGAPRSAEDLPAFNAQVLADFLDVADKLPGRVAFERCVGRALAAAALIEVHDAVFFRVEKPALLGLRAAARAAVQEDYGLAVRIAAFLKINFVDWRNLQASGMKRLNRRIEPRARLLHQRLAHTFIGHGEKYTYCGGTRGRNRLPLRPQGNFLKDRKS